MKRNTLNTFISATLIMLLGVSSSAQAIVPMGDLIGTTSVTFADQTLEDKSAPVYVSLKPSAPKITLTKESESGDWIPNVTETRVYTYAVTSTANGPDTYELAAVYNEQDSENIVSSPTVTPKTPVSLDLGATAAISSNGNVITVPYDKDGGVGSVNGIEVGDTVVIGDGDTEYTVGEVSNTEDLSTIMLQGDGPDSLALGDPIAERGEFEVTISNVALAGDGAGRADFTITATSSVDEKATESLSFAALAPVESSFEKYVRNTSDDGQCPDQVADCGQLRNQGYAEKFKNNWYFRTKVASEGDSNVVEHNPEALIKVESGEVLEYLIVLNAGNTKEEFNIRLSETLSPFTEYEEESAKYNRNQVQMPIDTVSMDDSTNTIMFTLCPTGSQYCKLKVNGKGQVTYQVRVLGGDGGEVTPQDDPNEDEVAGVPSKRFMARCLERNAGYRHELYLDNNNTVICASHNMDEFYKEVDLGVFPVDTELVFRLDVRNTGKSYFSGDPARNPDLEQHTTEFKSRQPGRTTIGFEDLFGGGDRDYDEIIFEYWSVDP